MPARDNHITQARHNRDFFGSFDTSRYSDWAATVLFYTALHYIDAFLATQGGPQGQHPNRHDVRDNYMTRIQELKPIASDYFRLKNFSSSARYNPPSPFTPAEIEALVNRHLAGIHAHLRQFVPI